MCMMSEGYTMQQQRFYMQNPNATAADYQK